MLLAVPSNTMDVLSILQDAIKSKSAISYTNGSEPASTLGGATHIVLSPSSLFPKSTPTRYRKPGSTSTDPASAPSSFFPLEAVYLAWQLRDATGAEYMKQAREDGLLGNFVSVTERKVLVDWLEGRLSTHENIVPLPSRLRFVRKSLPIRSMR